MAEPSARACPRPRAGVLQRRRRPAHGYAKQAAHDWHEFVAFRGRELCPGGQLVVMTMALDEHGEFGYRPLLDAVMDVLSELTADGLLTDDELRRMCLPIVGRQAADFLAPFAPSGRFERLSVEHLEVFDAEDRFWMQYQVDQDASAFGALWAAFVGLRSFRRWRRPWPTAGTIPGRRSSSTGWRPASPSGWPPRPSRCRSRSPSWC